MDNDKRSRLWSNVRGVLLVVVVFIGVRAFQTRDLPTGEAPALSGMDLQGHAVSLDDYRGKPVVLHFWASWCGVCSAMRHNVKAIADDVPVLSVASLSGRADEVSQHAREHDLRFAIVNDPSGNLARRFSVSAFPTTFVLDANGNIRHTEVGYTSELGLRIRSWLAAL